MIPKIIHYCWFGPISLPQNVKDCIESWKITNPEFEIKLWNELNFRVEDHPFMSRMHKEKRWAFVTDHARLVVLEREGGIFLDADMYLTRSLLPLTEYGCVLGEEAPETISAGMIGATPHHPFIQKCLSYYEANPPILITIPRVLTNVFATYSEKEPVKVFPPKTFYPIDAAHIHTYKGQDLGPDTIGVHLWNYSWGHPLNKLFKKLRIHALGVKIVELLGIKTLLKKIFGFV